MRAAFFNGPDLPITVEHIPEPQLRPGEILVRVCRCGICGSDVAMTGDGPFHLPLGRFGHEWSGEVIEVGRDVEGIGPGVRSPEAPAPSPARSGRLAATTMST